MLLIVSTQSLKALARLTVLGQLAVVGRTAHRRELRLQLPHPLSRLREGDLRARQQPLNRLARRERHLLWQVANGYARSDDYPAGVRLDLTGDNPKQGRLAHPILANQSDLLAGIEDEGRVAK